ncbi:hypothetical protein EYF80_050186 [Liparis tanakae]|uniref:Uncharacterized protein n=1 Tax=Liparis tanakae TaxID=230148 RepID=A0A4Z2FFI5_9TELE|nr:hypothetical protein EYF80_050186 [Liparis tanakae]
MTEERWRKGAPRAIRDTSATHDVRWWREGSGSPRGAEAKCAAGVHEDMKRLDVKSLVMKDLGLHWARHPKSR